MGKLPEKDIEGTIIANGTGLLGNKFMSGTTTRTPGFYKIDTGLVDGVAQQDRNGAYIDLGKFLSIVPGLLQLPDSPISGTNGGIVNGAALYCGMVTQVTPGNSTTNALVPKVSVPFVIKKPKLNSFAGSGYVMFQLKDQGVVVSSGELATNANSDYALKMLNHVGLAKYFPTILGYDSVKNPKPHPEMVYKALDIHSIKKENAQLIGDSHKDIMAATRAGVDSVLVNWGFSNHE